MRARAWAGAWRGKILIFGVTDAHTMEAREIAMAVRDAGQDGGGAVERERDENERIDACPLRDASERGQEDVCKLAGQCPLKEWLPTIEL